MAGMSDFLEDEIRKHIFRTGSYTKPTVLAISLHNTDAGNDATASWAATEVPNTNAYARQVRNPLDGNWTGAVGSGFTDNIAAITFATPTGAGWGTVICFGIWDNATYGAGNLLFSGTLSASQLINAGNVASFAIGALDVTFA